MGHVMTQQNIHKPVILLINYGKAECYKTEGCKTLVSETNNEIIYIIFEI